MVQARVRELLFHYSLVWQKGLEITVKRLKFTWFKIRHHSLLWWSLVSEFFLQKTNLFQCSRLTFSAIFKTNYDSMRDIVSFWGHEKINDKTRKKIFSEVFRVSTSFNQVSIVNQAKHRVLYVTWKLDTLRIYFGYKSNAMMLFIVLYYHLDFFSPWWLEDTTIFCSIQVTERRVYILWYQKQYRSLIHD